MKNFDLKKTQKNHNTKICQNNVEYFLFWVTTSIKLTWLIDIHLHYLQNLDELVAKNFQILKTIVPGQ